MAASGVPWSFVVYTAAFGVATLGCAAGAARAFQVEDLPTRQGLVALLASSCGWSLFEFGFLLAPTPGLAYAMYTGSLIVGLLTVGAWLYFCSAYTGRAFHRNARLRRLAVVVYLGIVAVKLTNPVHGLYFTTEFVATPFPHLTIEHGIVHWLVAGLSYALAAVGLFMLYEMFIEAEYDTRLLGAVVGFTAFPVVFDIAGFTSPFLLDINYEPLGVAIFAVGVLFAFKDRFLAVQLTRGVTDPIVYLDSGGRIREYNDLAADMFPSLSGATGDEVADTLPGVVDVLGSDYPVLERDRDGERRYYLVSDTDVSLGQTDIGRMIVFTDVTETERQRRELERHNDQLEGFAAAVRHELLNTLQIVDARVTIAGDALEEGNVGRANESLATAARTTDRMTGIVADLADIARYGQTPEKTERLALGEAAEAALEAVDADGIDLSVEDDGELRANSPRLHDLFRNVFTFAAHNGASEVTVTLREDCFAVADDGDPPLESDTDAFFEYGRSAPDPDAGLSLPNVAMLARTQGWEVTVDDGYDDGVRIVVSGVSVPSGAA